MVIAALAKSLGLESVGKKLTQTNVLSLFADEITRIILKTKRNAIAVIVHRCFGA